MKFAEALEKLQSSEEYLDWRKKNADAYLSHGFIMSDPSVKQEWQIGYFIPKRKTVLSFSVSDKITLNPESEVFSEDKHIEKLDLGLVKATLEEAMAAADKVQKEKYSAHTPLKKIVILQKLDVGQVWNITFVTQSFKTLNIKIDSATGKLISDELIDLFRIEK